MPALLLCVVIMMCCRDVAEDAARFREALGAVVMVAAGCSVLLQLLQLSATISEAHADGLSLTQLLLLQ